MHEELQDLRDKHEHSLWAENHKKEGLQEELAAEKLKVSNLKEGKRRHTNEAANHQTQIQAIFDEVKKYDSNLSPF